MRFLFVIIVLFWSALQQSADAQDPEFRDYRAEAKILRIVGGYRHGSMIEVEGRAHDGTTSSLWLCLDPGAEVMSREESDRLFATALIFYSGQTKVDVAFYRSVTATDCRGGYPVVEDIRPTFPSH